MSKRDEILAEIDSIPALPPVATEAAQLLQDEDVNFHELVPVIEHDPGLTANLLRLCNSASIRGRTEIYSVQDAIVRLGVRQVLELVMMDSMRALTMKPVKGYDLPSGQLWEHSVAVALGAQKLADQLRLEVRPCTYTSALLHDIGKCVLGTFLDLEAGPVILYASEHGIPFEEAEKSVLGIDHAEVGAALLEQWNLPPAIIEIVRYHHRPELSRTETQSAYLVHTADLLAMESGIGSGIDGLNYRPSSEVIGQLGLNVHILEYVICTVHEDLAKIKGLFNGKDGEQKNES